MFASVNRQLPGPAIEVRWEGRERRGQGSRGMGGKREGGMAGGGVVSALSV